MQRSHLPRTVLMLFAVLLPWSFAAQAKSAEADSRAAMNVLFIAVDDLRPELGCYGVQDIKTPNIDRLAARGMVFNRAYCQQSLCSPSRMSLMTGLRPDSTRIYDLETPLRQKLPDVVTVSQHFKAHGYHAQSFGKIFHGGRNDELSWSVPHTPNRADQYISDEIMARIRQRGAQGWEVGQLVKGPAWESGDAQDSELPDGYIADHAIAAMRNVKDKPFFLAVGFIKPHLPLVAPQKYFDLYPLEQFKLPANYRRPDGAPSFALTDFGELRAYEEVPKQGPLSDRAALELIRAYYASVSFVDAQVGRVMDELETLGLSERTIIVLWGDHGWHLGDQGMWCKHTNFEAATRSPLIVAAPGQKTAGQTTDALVELVDVYPTLCDLAGLPLPQGLEGISTAPLLKDPNRAWKEFAISQYPRSGKVMGYSIRTDRWRYTEWQSRDEAKTVLARELYDHRNDPGETKNLAEDPAQAQTIKALSGQLAGGWRSALPHDSR